MAHRLTSVFIAAFEIRRFQLTAMMVIALMFIGQGLSAHDHNDDNEIRFKPRYTQLEFTRLQSFEIGDLTSFSVRGRFVVTGFTPQMSTWLVQMAHINRAAAQRLVRDMGGLTDRAQRRARLQREFDEIWALIINIDASIVRLRQEDYVGVNVVIGREQRDRNKAMRRVNVVQAWLNDPNQGTYSE